MSKQPTVKAFLLCRSVPRRRSPDQLQLEGLFTVVCGKWFPIRVEQMFLFIRLADGTGAYEASFRLVFLENREVIAAGSTGLRMEPGIPGMDFVVEAGRVVLPWEGRYEVELYLDDELVETSGFDALRIDPRSSVPSSIASDSG